MPSKPDLTGFDPQKFAAAAGQPKNDPWARAYVNAIDRWYLATVFTDIVHREAWRYTGPFTRRNRFKNAFPGFGIAAAAFAGFLVYEQIFLTKSHGHGEGHGEGHH